MDLSEYQEQAVKTAIYPGRYKILYPAIGLGNEAGEVLGKIKKVLRDKDGEFSPEEVRKIADEIGDVLWYMAALASDLGVSLSLIAQENLVKLASREQRGTIQGSGDSR